MHQPALCHVALPRARSAHVPQPVPDTIPRPEPEAPARAPDIPDLIPPEIQEPVLPGEHSPIGEPWVPDVPPLAAH